MLFAASLLVLFTAVVAPFAPNSLYVVTSGISPGLAPGGNGPPPVTVPAILEDWRINSDRSVRLVNQYTLPGSLYSTSQYEGSLFLNPQTNNITVATRNLQPGISIPSIPVNITPYIHTLSDSLRFSSESMNAQVLSEVSINSAFSNNNLIYWLTNLGTTSNPLLQSNLPSPLPLLSTPLITRITFWNFIDGDLYATTNNGPKMLKIGSQLPTRPYQPWSIVNGFQSSSGSTSALLSGFFQDRPNSLWLLDNYSPNSQLQRYTFEPTRSTWIQAERYGIPIPSSGPSTGLYIWQGFTGRLELGRPIFYLHNRTHVFQLSLDVPSGVKLSVILVAPQGVRIQSIIAPASIPTPTMSTSSTISPSVTSTLSATSSNTPTASLSGTGSPTASGSPTQTPTLSRTASLTVSGSPTPTPTPTLSETTTTTSSGSSSPSNSITITSSTFPSPTSTPPQSSYIIHTRTVTPTATFSSSLTPSPSPSPSMPGNGTDPAANSNQQNELTPADAFGVSIGVLILIAGVIILLFCFGPSWIKASMKRTFRLDKFQQKRLEPPRRQGSVRDTVLQISENPMTNATAASQQMLEMKRTIELQEERLRQLEGLKSFANKTKIQFGPVQTQLPGAVV